MNISPKLTAPQARYLAEIREAGERSYNGRARRPLEALERAGLIEYDYALVPRASGSGLIGELTERFTARPAPARFVVDYEELGVRGSQATKVVEAPDAESAIDKVEGEGFPVVRVAPITNN